MVMGVEEYVIFLGWCGWGCVSDLHRFSCTILEVACLLLYVYQGLERGIIKNRIHKLVQVEIFDVVVVIFYTPNGVAGKLVVVNSRDGAVVYKTVEKFGNAAAN
jgi:predicted membrane-bound mannosyltransferase